MRGKRRLPHCLRGGGRFKTRFLLPRYTRSFMLPGFVEVAKARETSFIFGMGEKAPEGLQDFDFEDANGVRHVNVGEQPTHF